MLTVSLDSLAWIRPEIEHSLETARQRLDAFSEERDNPKLFDEFIEQLHQATGSLSMLELHGGQELAEQMEALALAVHEGRLAGDLESFELLMRGCLELSDYLEGLLSGVRDPAAILLPITNEVRIRLGRGPVVHERAGRARPRLVPTPSGEEDMVSLAARLRPDYQAAWLDFYRERDKAGAVAGMAQIVTRLEATATDPTIFELLWILGGLLEALADGGLAASRSIKQALGQFERELKRLAAGSEEVVEDAAPDALADRLLAEIEQSTTSGERVSAIRAVFQLENDAGVWVAHAAVPGSSLLASAGGAVLEDLGRVRDRIDIFVRTGSGDVGNLAPLDGMLKKVSDALSMLGLETARVHAEEQREAIRRLVESEQGDATALLGVATGLVGVEGDVEAYLAGRDETPAGLVERNARMAGLREALADISRLKEAFSEFVRNRAPSRLELLPPLVDTLAGTLEFLAMGDAAALMRRIGRYIKGLAAGGAVPERTELDRLADAVVSVEYWLETLQRGRQAPISMLENADRALQFLEAGSAETPELVPAVEPDTEPTAAVEPEPVPEPESEAEFESALESQAEARAAAPSGAPSGEEREPLPPVREPGVDPEIIAVFMDEAAEVNEALAEAWPAWRDNPDSRDALTVIRRSFHTLKGSGRMVGARRLGEFAWAYENLLNRVIDYTLPPTVAVVEAVGEAIDATRELLAEFDVDTAPNADVDELFARAWGLAQGSALTAEATVGTSARAAEETVPEELASGAESAVESGETGAVAAESSEEEVAPEPVFESEPEPESEAEPEPEPELEFAAAEAETETETETETDEAALAPFAPTPRIDPVLYGIYRRETEVHLAALGAWLDAASADAATVSPELCAAAHALADSAGRAGVEEMAALFSPLDAVLDRIGEAGVEPTDLLASRVERALLMGRALLAAYGDDSLPVPDWESSAGELEAFNRELESSAAEQMSAEEEAGEEREVEAVEEAVETGEERSDEAAGRAGEPIVEARPVEVVDLNADVAYDAEIAQVFVAEAAELLDSSDAAVHAWSANHDLTEPLAELLRHLHTIKGGARVAGVSPFADLAHELESLLIRVSDGRIAVSRELLHLVERALDRLHQMLSHVASSGKVPLASAMIAELREFARGESESPHEPEEEAEAEREVEEAGEAEPSGETGATPEGEGWREAPQLRHEMAHVRADLLESSINNAGEVSIYRGRIEQQLVNMKVHIAELDRTVERLHNELRELEMETEAQILSSYAERPEAADRGFDPLELDRYTRIHELSRSLAEAVSDLTSLRELFATELRQTGVLLERQGRVNTDLQDALMRTRMVPFELSAPRLRRLVRRVAEESGKNVVFEIKGGGGEMDRQMVGHILPALEHLLRNAVVHGIEAPELRAERGKPELGQIMLELRQDGGDMLIEVSDDGGGLDLAAIRAKAVEANIIRADAELTEEEIAELVFRPGFTTATDVTQSAGRGVGMDVVATEARQVGGATEIHSEPGRGTRCLMRLPVTLAITQVLLVRVGRTRYPVALASIGAVARLAQAELEELFQRDAPVYEYGGETYQLVSLARVLGEELPPDEERAARQPLLLVNSGGRRIALVADDMEGSREIVVKPVGPQVARVAGLAGATIFGDGSIGLLLDLSALVRSLPQLQPEVEEPRPAPAEAGDEEPGEPLVMVVDDSITVRRVTRRLLERNGARVLAARDGIEALDLLQNYRPDAMLLDIEMPRMDGYELAGYMQKDERLRSIPIIIITSRSGEKHRARAEEIGIAHYLGKPWQDAALLAAIQEVAPRFTPMPARDWEEPTEDQVQEAQDE